MRLNWPWATLPRRHAQVAAERFLCLFDAHAVERMQIPRLVPEVGYAHLDDLKTLLGAMTPAVIDSVLAVRLQSRATRRKRKATRLDSGPRVGFAVLSAC